MSFRKDILSMQITTLIHILAGFIYFPLLARVFRFPAETFGQFQYINSITMIIMSFALLSLDLAFISDQKEQNQRQTSAAFSTMVILGISVFAVSAIVLILGHQLGLLNIETPFVLILLFAGTSLVYERAFYALFREKKQFTYVAKERVIVAISHPLTGCLLALFFRNAYVLLIAFAVSHLWGALYYQRAAKMIGIMPRWMTDRKAIREFVSKNWNVLVFQTPSAFLNTFYHNLPVLLMRKVFSPEILGFYSLSMRVLGTTNRLLSQALYETFLPYVAKSQNNRKYALRIFPVICALFFPVFFTASLLAPWYVRLLFGESFLYVSDIIKIMAPFYFTQAAVGPYIGFILVYRRSEINLAVNLGGVILRTGLFFLGVKIWGLEGGLYAISVAGILVYQTFLLVATRLADGSIASVSFSLLFYQVVLFVISFDLITAWFIPLLLIPSAIVLQKNRSILFRGKSISN